MSKIFQKIRQFFREPDTSKVHALEELSTSSWKEIQMFAIINKGKELILEESINSIGTDPQIIPIAKKIYVCKCFSKLFSQEVHKWYCQLVNIIDNKCLVKTSCLFLDNADRCLKLKFVEKIDWPYLKSFIRNHITISTITRSILSLRKNQRKREMLKL